MRVYADNAATSQLSEQALAAMLPWLRQNYGNPSSLHTPGQEAAAALSQARQAMADRLNCRPGELIFTSGGSEADNQALLSLARAGAKKGKRHIISSAFEHHAVLHTLNRLEREGFEVSLLDVHADGLVWPEEVQAFLRPDTCLVTVMFANNEIGTIQPIAQIGAVCRAAGVPFHTDAVQAAGHLPLDVQAQNIDLLSLSAHKFNGPRGAGLLYAKGGLPVMPLIEGGAQERGKRAGTENVAAIVGMAAAFDQACEHMAETAARLTRLRDKLIAGLSQIPHSALNGHALQRLPGNVSFCFEGVEGEALLLLLDQRGVAASSGSACTSGSLDPSHVLLAIGRPHEVAHGSLRLSLGPDTTEAEIDYLLQEIPPIVSYLRSISPLWQDLVSGRQAFRL